MQYRKDRYGEDLSILGYGCMRFSRKNGGIDVEKTEKEILAAYQAGVNYYDTAYIYPGSEAALGLILERNGLRDKVHIATKLPQYLIQRTAALDRYFEEQLRRLRTDRIDYYLMHQLTDFAQWEKLKALGIEAWIAEKKRVGAIRNIGFSYHGNTDQFLKILADFDWDFCQIQYNYMDRNDQAGERGVALCTEKEIPLVIMEPIKGGTLATLPEEVMTGLRELRPEASPASWALRFVGSRPIVHVILSGMSAEDQLADNLNTFTNFEPLSEEEEKAIEATAAAIRARVRIGCTGCRYCMPCPNGVDIPRNFRIWNNYGMYGNVNSAKWQWGHDISAEAKPDNCLGCGACEAACPQQLSIIENLQACYREMESL